MKISKQKELMNTFSLHSLAFPFHVSWPYHGNKISYLDERCLSIVYKKSSFGQLLEKDSFASIIHHLNLQKLTIEMLKIKNKLLAPIVKEICNQKIINT